MVVFPTDSDYYVTIEDFSGGGEGVLDVYFDDIVVSNNPAIVFEGCKAPGPLVESDAVCDCAGSTNHGKYVKCVNHKTNQMVKDGILKPKEAADVRVAAAQSSCGKKSDN